MRIQLATPLKTRTGDTLKDARMKNSYAEVRGDQSVVRKRMGVYTALATASGESQGGISNNSLAYVINGDSLRSYDSSGTLIATIAL